MASTPISLISSSAGAAPTHENQAGEVSISRSRLENEVDTLRSSLSELTENVARLRSQLRLKSLKHRPVRVRHIDPPGWSVELNQPLLERGQPCLDPVLEIADRLGADAEFQEVKSHGAV